MKLTPIENIGIDLALKIKDEIKMNAFVSLADSGIIDDTETVLTASPQAIDLDDFLGGIKNV